MTPSAPSPLGPRGRVAPRVVVTLGDPRGIGPEVVHAAVREWHDDAAATLLVLGPEGMDPGGVPYESLGTFDGTPTSAGRLVVDSVRRAVEIAMAGEAQGVVTGPAHKPTLRSAGVNTPGHTELLQQLTDAPCVGMLMAAEETRVGAPLRVLLATTHLPFRDVPRVLTTGLLVDQTRLLHAALLRDWRIPGPRIALCALNPHASDDGLFGDEEKRIYEPAIDRLRDEGLEVSSPLPADTVFSRALAGEFDAVVAPYHDVGMAAFKTLSFGSGVNVTLGLPFVRTSPDHGTAFDLVGTGRANPASTRHALRLAVQLARARLDL